MSRRETFLESAKAANDRALNSTSAPQVGTASTSDPTAIPAAAAETNRRLEALERSLLAAMAPAGTSAPPRISARRRASTMACVLAAALATLVAITLLRPEWALRSRQRAELLLGERLYQRLQHMEERDRLEVLKSLWEDPKPTTD